MVTIVKNGNKVAYGINKYLCDDETDLSTINLSTANPGSTAFLADTSQYFILNNDYEWIEIIDPDVEELNIIGTGVIN